MFTPMRGALLISAVELTSAGPPGTGVGVTVAFAVTVGVAVFVVVVGVGVAPTAVGVGVTPTELGVGVGAIVPVGVGVGPPATGWYAMIALAQVVELFTVQPVQVVDGLPGIKYPLSRLVLKEAVPPALRSAWPVYPFMGPDDMAAAEPK
jgi:hypothetical protein